MMHVTLNATSVVAPASTVYRVAESIIKGTLSHLRKYARQGMEGVGYWVGSYRPLEAEVGELWIPRFEATSVSYDVRPQEMLRLRKELDASGHVLLAQVHSHPGSAFHSSRDDVYAASPWPGFISIVVPNGGRINRPFFEVAEVFECSGGSQWRRLGPEEKYSRFVVYEQAA